MQAHLVTAPGDGVAPAVLLSLPAANAAASAAGGGPPPAQYLFNVPEGFSRLVLEHRLRPGGQRLGGRGWMDCFGRHFGCMLRRW